MQAQANFLDMYGLGWAELPDEDEEKIPAATPTPEPKSTPVAPGSASSEVEASLKHKVTAATKLFESAKKR